MLPIAPSTYYAHKVVSRAPERASARVRREAALRDQIRRVFDANFQVYGVRKIWRQLRRDGEAVARCTVERLMREMGLQGAVRGKPAKTTVSDRANPCPQDKVHRQFQPPKPNALWVSDFTYVATWQGFVYVACVIDAFARRIVGWRVSRTAQAGVEPSVGSVGDSYDNALAETINGLYKAEVIHRRGPWRSLEAVEYATLEWVDWFNHRRLLEPIGNIPPAEAEARYYAETERTAVAA